MRENDRLGNHNSLEARASLKVESPRQLYEVGVSKSPADIAVAEVMEVGSKN